MDTTVTVATIDDIPQLLHLINSAYRGEEAKKGWTHEADLIEGPIRTDEISLQELIGKPDAIFLKYAQHNVITGCVYLEKRINRLYLGMLSVSPETQAKGIGKKLLRAAEVFAKQNECAIIEMTVISIRRNLIDWYERNGYCQSGRTEPFPSDGKFGKPRQNLEFVFLEKKV